MIILRKIWAFYNKKLVDYPTTTQGFIAGSLFSCGDVICQIIERSNQEKKESKEVKNKKEDEIDWLRVGRMCTVGFVVVGPACHYWYKFLDKRMQSTTVAQALKKTLVDETLFGPVYLASFFVSIGILEGMNSQQIVQKIKKDFWPTFLMDMVVWPPAQTINFYFVPPAYRVLYISFISLFWNAYLSMVQHRH